MDKVLLYDWKDTSGEIRIYSSPNRDKLAKIYPTAKVFGFKSESDPKGTNLKMGRRAEIGDFCYVNCRGGVEIGDYSHIHAGSKVIGGGGLFIKRYVAVTYDVMLITGTDRITGIMTDGVDDPSTRNQYLKPINIGDHVYIGSKSIIMPGVNIGEGTIVQAFSYVGKNTELESWKVYGGIPCVEKGEREIKPEQMKAFRKWEEKQAQRT